MLRMQSYIISRISESHSRKGWAWWKSFEALLIILGTPTLSVTLTLPWILRTWSSHYPTVIIHQVLSTIIKASINRRRHYTFSVLAKLKHLVYLAHIVLRRQLLCLLELLSIHLIEEILKVSQQVFLLVFVTTAI